MGVCWFTFILSSSLDLTGGGTSPTAGVTTLQSRGSPKPTDYHIQTGHTEEAGVVMRASSSPLNTHTHKALLSYEPAGMLSKQAQNTKHFKILSRKRLRV